MHIQIFSDYQAMSVATARFVAEYVRQTPHALLCFPSGETPTGTLHRLVELARLGEVDFSRSRFVGLDEWAGMDRTQEGSCQHYMDKHFFHPLSIKPEQVVFFNARAHDLEQECERINHWLRTNGPIDIMLVGVGMNGHLGLNEPGTSFHSEAHTSVLDPLTKTVGQKYFTQPTPLEGGVTLGLQHVMEAKVAILIASGEKKANVVASAVEGAVTEQLPASILQTHPNGHLFLDETAASQLKNKTSSV